jgi:hypothetical protein
MKAMKIIFIIFFLLSLSPNGFAQDFGGEIISATVKKFDAERRGQKKLDTIFFEYAEEAVLAGKALKIAKNGGFQKASLEEIMGGKFYAQMPERVKPPFVAIDWAERFDFSVVQKGDSSETRFTQNQHRFSVVLTKGGENLSLEWFNGEWAVSVGSFFLYYEEMTEAFEIVNEIDKTHYFINKPFFAEEVLPGYSVDPRLKEKMLKSIKSF